MGYLQGDQQRSTGVKGHVRGLQSGFSARVGALVWVVRVRAVRRVLVYAEQVRRECADAAVRGKRLLQSTPGKRTSRKDHRPPLPELLVVSLCRLMEWHLTPSTMRGAYMW
jgi:hypothetical protein